MAVARRATMSKASILEYAERLGNRRTSVSTSVLVNAALRLRICDFRKFLKLKSGMTNAEASAAIDEALQNWVNCMKRNHR